VSIIIIYQTEKTPYLNINPDKIKITGGEPNFVLLSEPFDEEDDYEYN